MTRVYDTVNKKHLDSPKGNVTALLFQIGKEHPDCILGWCNVSAEPFLDISALEAAFHHQKMLVSYSPGSNYLPPAIGYVELGSFIKVNKRLTFPTWQMSSAAGAIPAAVLALFEAHVTKEENFDYFLNSLAVRAMPLGLFCFSEPKILSGNLNIQVPQASSIDLFRFVKQHYKSVWVCFLLLNLVIYEKRFPLMAAIFALFHKKRTLQKTLLSHVGIVSKKPNQKEKTIDILIPTIGRKPYLHDVLKDLASQTVLPKRVIVTEQNPLPGSTSELDYLCDQWPFEIKHIFTNQPGVCNARNLALLEVKSDWVFLADDDIRIESTFIEDAFNKMYEVNGEVFNFCCINPGQERQYDLVHQTSIFAGSCSIISRKSLGNTIFDPAFEFGYGEDNDFGMQLMNKGYDIGYLPEPAVRHLKAPSGGFRMKMKQLWDDDPIKPKPAPTVMLYKQLHHSKEQLNGYKTTLFIKYYTHQPEKNPFKYFKLFARQWKRSAFWANELRSSGKLILKKS
ncbi:MAG TPA: glycosyltransferase [Flavobacterium sp.]